MKKIAVYPGSFDPVTFGHLDIAARAAALFDEIHIVVVHNPNKTPMFSLVDRVELVEQSLAEAGLSTALFCAVRLPQPLLLEGEAGVGKTQAAKALADMLDTPLIRLQCFEGIDA